MKVSHCRNYHYIPWQRQRSLSRNCKCLSVDTIWYSSSSVLLLAANTVATKQEHRSIDAKNLLIFVKVGADVQELPSKSCEKWDGLWLRMRRPKANAFRAGVRASQNSGRSPRFLKKCARGEAGVQHYYLCACLLLCLRVPFSRASEYIIRFSYPGASESGSWLGYSDLCCKIRPTKSEYPWV